MRLPMKNLIAGSDTIDTIVFDFDGTLADTLTSSLLAFQATLDQFALIPPHPISIETYGPLSVEGMFQHLGVNDRDMQNEMIGCYNAHYRQIAPVRASVFPGVRSTLGLLSDRGFNLAIATNELRENLGMLLTAFDLDRFFDTTCCADEVEHPKPRPDMGREVMARLGAHAGRTLMLGDSLCDIEMARQNAMLSCAVGWGATPFDRLLDASPHLGITDFPQLLDIVGVTETETEFHSIFFNRPTGIFETSLAY